VRDQVSHPYKTAGKIIVLYILSFTILDSQQGKSLWTQWLQVLPKFTLLFISSWIKFHLLQSFPNI
jgi:hypothetical protein